MKTIIIPIIITLLLISCNSNTIFREHNKFDDLSWNRMDFLIFEVPIQKNESLDFYLALRHHTNFPFGFLDANITFYTPDGEMRSRDYHFNLKDKELKWKGDGMGELWDIEVPIRKNMIFNKTGICKVRIENKMKQMETPGIIEAGLIVKKAN